MCDPVSIGSLAVGAAGSALSGYERNQSAAAMQNARNQATEQELARQKVYGNETRGDFNKSLDIYAPGAQATGLADAQRTTTDAITRNAPTDVGSITTVNAPRAVGASEDSRMAGVFAKSAQKDANLGALKGYGQQQFGNNIALNNNGRDIDMVGDFTKVSSGVNGVEQRAAAQNAYRPPSGLGDLLQFAGRVGANQAGRGGGGLASTINYGGSSWPAYT